MGVLLSEFQCEIDVGTDVGATQPIKKTGTIHDEQGLRVRSTENEMTAFSREFVVEVHEDGQRDRG